MKTSCEVRPHASRHNAKQNTVQDHKPNTLHMETSFQTAKTGGPLTARHTVQQAFRIALERNPDTHEALPATLLSALTTIARRASGAHQPPLLTAGLVDRFTELMVRGIHTVTTPTQARQPQRHDASSTGPTGR